MATPQIVQNSVFPLRVAEAPRNFSGLNKLFEAAVLNHQFRLLLLNQPEIALRQGYLGGAFDFNPGRTNAHYFDSRQITSRTRSTNNQSDELAIL